jgi:hypothetical protein
MPLVHVDKATHVNGTTCTVSKASFTRTPFLPAA